MKIKWLYAQAFALSSSIGLAMGIGDINVKSYLNQPFKAEIPLIDADGMPLNGIRVSIAPSDSFNRAGIDRNEALSGLFFNVVQKGPHQVVVEVNSNQRISEPYLEMIVDLAWSKGQTYRVYTVLLDPPGYTATTLNPAKSLSTLQTHFAHIQATIKDASLDNNDSNVQSVAKREKSVYGPVKMHDSIWQIAQRYRANNVTLPQIILAIVGTNSQAFTQGNLNGLKTGEILYIPGSNDILKVPSYLAQEEVDAQNQAWKSQQEIKHRLLPPYINGQQGSSQFSDIVQQVPQLLAGTKQLHPDDKTPRMPVPEIKATLTSAVVVNQSFVQAQAPFIDLSLFLPTVALLQPGHESYLKSPYRMSIIPSLNLYPGIAGKQGNQITRLQSQNLALQQKITKQADVLVRLQKKIVDLADTTKPAPVKTTILALPVEHHHVKFYWSLLILSLIAISLLLWRSRITSKSRMKDNLVCSLTPKLTPETLPVPSPLYPDLKLNSQSQPLVPDPEQVVVSDHNSEPAELDLAHHTDNMADLKAQKNQAQTLKPAIEPLVPAKVVSTPPNIVEFEPGLDKVLLEQNQDTVEITQPPKVLTSKEDNSMVPLPIDDNIALPKNTTRINPDVLNVSIGPTTHPLVKSKTALVTLLELAKTYISMDDFQSAIESLEEVHSYGDQELQKAAQALLDLIKAKQG